MHDIKLIRDDPVAFDAGIERRGLEPLSADILRRDAELRVVLTRLSKRRRGAMKHRN